MSLKKQLKELEVRARNLIVEIVPMVKTIPANTFSGLNEFLDGALADAKASLSVSRQETERRIRLAPTILQRAGFRRPNV